MKTCEKCSHSAVCSIRKQMEALRQKLEYEARLLENQHFTIRCECEHFSENKLTGVR